MPLIELMRIVVSMRVIVVVLYFFLAALSWALSPHRRGALRAGRRSRLTLAWARAVLTHVEVDLLLAVERRVLGSFFDYFSDDTVWLGCWLGCISAAAPSSGLDVVITNSIVNFVLVVPSLVLLDFGRDLGGGIGREIWITDELEFEEVLDWLLQRCLHLAHDVAGSLDSFLYRDRDRIEILVNWVDGLGWLMKVSPLLLSHIMHAHAVVVAPWMMTVAVATTVALITITVTAAVPSSVATICSVWITILAISILMPVVSVIQPASVVWPAPVALVTRPWSLFDC